MGTLLSKEDHQERDMYADSCMKQEKLETVGKKEPIKDGDGNPGLEPVLRTGGGMGTLLSKEDHQETGKDKEQTKEAFGKPNLLLSKKIIPDFQERILTGPEWKAYSKKLKKSQGFDVGEIPDGVLGIPIAPIQLHGHPRLEELRGCCKLALQKYNSKKRRKTKYEFVKILKATVDLSGYYICHCTTKRYYLTFEAKEVTGSCPQNKNFQARVVLDWMKNENTVVEFCRPEPTS